MADSVTARHALVLFAHGSRDPQWAEPFRAIQRSVAQQRPGVAVELAFLEMMKPTLPEVVDRLVATGTASLHIAPLFMAQGAHLKRDLALMLASLQERNPQIELTLLPALGEARQVVDAIAEWLVGYVSTR